MGGAKKGVPYFDVDQKILPSIKGKIHNVNSQIRMVDNTPYFCTEDTVRKLPELYGSGFVDTLGRIFRGPISEQTVSDLIREAFSRYPKVEREHRRESLPSSVTPVKLFQRLVIRHIWSMDIRELSTVDGKFNEKFNSD